METFLAEFHPGMLFLAAAVIAVVIVALDTILCSDTGEDDEPGL